MGKNGNFSWSLFWTLFYQHLNFFCLQYFSSFRTFMSFAHWFMLRHTCHQIESTTHFHSKCIFYLKFFILWRMIDIVSGTLWTICPPLDVRSRCYSTPRLAVHHKSNAPQHLILVLTTYSFRHLLLHKWNLSHRTLFNIITTRCCHGYGSLLLWFLPTFPCLKESLHLIVLPGDRRNGGGDLIFAGGSSSLI